MQHANVERMHYIFGVARNTQTPKEDHMQFPERIIPDQNTRAGRMLAAGDVPGTVLSDETGQHITVRYKAFADTRDRQFDQDSNKNWVRCDYVHATHLFIEVPTPDDDGWADKVGTFYPKSGRFYTDNNCDPA